MGATKLSTGDAVQTPFGKGTVREVRNNGQVLVEVRARALVFREAEISPLDVTRSRVRSRSAASPSGLEPERQTCTSQTESRQIDLHGLTVEQALATAERALDDAIRADLPELRFIHGKSGGRIREALHRWLRQIHTVRLYRIDPRNEGVTIVEL